MKNTKYFVFSFIWIISVNKMTAHPLKTNTMTINRIDTINQLENNTELFNDINSLNITGAMPKIKWYEDPAVLFLLGGYCYVGISFCLVKTCENMEDGLHKYPIGNVFRVIWPLAWFWYLYTFRYVRNCIYKFFLRLVRSIWRKKNNKDIMIINMEEGIQIE